MIWRIFFEVAKIDKKTVFDIGIFVRNYSDVGGVAGIISVSPKFRIRIVKSTDIFELPPLLFDLSWGNGGSQK